MDAANDPAVRTVCLMWASQTTKTTLLENILGYFVAGDPSPILMVQPTVETAQAWSKERFGPTVRDTPVLRDLVNEAKSRDAGNTIQNKTFPGGNLAIVGANAPSGLAGRSRRVVLLDEVDRFPASAGTEGDPVALAVRRTESFWNSVIYLTSTPTVRGGSRIETEFEGTDKRKWFCPCPRCGAHQTLEWGFVKWPEGKPEEAYLECKHCAAKLTDADRVQMIRAGEWRATAPFQGKRGYFLNGIYSPFKPKRGFRSRLHQMVSDFLEAKRGGPEQLKTWTNTFLAETWEEEAEKIALPELLARREPYTLQTLPAEVVLVVGGADVQKDRVEVEWIGVGNLEETWGIEAIKVFGDTEKPETWARLSQAVEGAVFKRVDGVELRPTCLAIDFHYRPKATKEWATNPGTRCMVFPVIGVGSVQGVLALHRPKHRTWTISTDTAKDIIFARLGIDVPGPRYCHFPLAYSDEFFTQLTSERKVTRYTRGFPKRIYEKTDGARNEALDMRVYSLAALDILRPNIPQIAANLAPAQAAKDAPPASRRVVRQDARRGGWVSGWLAG